MNCGLGTKQMKPFLQRLSDYAGNESFITAYPNAGIPHMGCYKQTPEQMMQEIEDIVNDRLINVIGGCCGTTPSHIELISNFLAAKKPLPRPRNMEPTQTDVLKLSGMEHFEYRPKFSNFLNIGERCNVSGSSVFKEMLKNGKFEDAIQVANKQVESGACVLDINMDEAMLDSEALMQKFCNLIASDPACAKVPLMIDSSSFPVIEKGLKCCQGKCIVNSLSLKEGEEHFIEHVKKIQKHGAALVVIAFDELGQATTKEKKFEICQRAYNILTKKLNFPAEDIIFDINVLPIATGMPEHNNYAVEFIECCKMIKAKLPGAKISGGISNLSFSFRGLNEIREGFFSSFF